MGGVGAFAPAAFAVGAGVSACAFFGALALGFGFGFGLLFLEPLAGFGASSAWWWVGVADVSLASGFVWGAVHTRCDWGVDLLGVSVSERVQVVVVRGGGLVACVQ